MKYESMRFDQHKNLVDYDDDVLIFKVRTLILLLAKAWDNKDTIKVILGEINDFI